MSDDDKNTDSYRSTDDKDPATTGPASTWQRIVACGRVNLITHKSLALVFATLVLIFVPMVRLAVYHRDVTLIYILSVSAAISSLVVGLMSWDSKSDDTRLLTTSIVLAVVTGLLMWCAVIVIAFTG